MSSSDVELEAFIQRVREVFFALRGISDELLADLDCTAVERSVLHEIDGKGPQTVPAMAQVRRVSRQAMQKTVDRLLERQWLSLQDNPRHARSPLMALTPAGQQVLAEIHRRERRLLTGTTLPVGEAELRRTTRTLQTLGKFIGSLDTSRVRRKTATAGGNQ